MLPEWSGSTCCTMRYSGHFSPRASAIEASQSPQRRMSTASTMVMCSSRMRYELYDMPAGSGY